MVNYSTDDKEGDKQNNNNQRQSLLSKRNLRESEESIKIPSQQSSTTKTGNKEQKNNNSSNNFTTKIQNNTNKRSAATLHINALKLEESEVDIDMTKLCGTNEQQKQIQMDIKVDNNCLITKQKVHHDEDYYNIKHLTTSSSSAFSSFSPKGDMNTSTTNDRMKRSPFIIPATNNINNSRILNNSNSKTPIVSNDFMTHTNGKSSTSSSSSQDLSCASSFAMYSNVHVHEDDGGERNNNNNSSQDTIISDQDKDDCKLTGNQNKISMSNNNTSNRTKRMISSKKNCPISTPNTVYFLHDAKERSCTGSFSIYYKPTTTNKINNSNVGTNPIAFKLKLKSSVSNFHFAAKPAIGFICPGEKIEIQVTVYKLPQLLDYDHNDREEYIVHNQEYDGRGEKKKNINRPRDKNDNIFAKDMLVLFTTSFTGDLSTNKSSPCWGNMTDLKRAWKTWERERTELITSHLLKRLVLVQENGDVYFSSCIHNIYDAMSLSNSFLNNNNNNHKKNAPKYKELIGSKQLQRMEDEDNYDKTTFLILHHLKLILWEIQDSQKMCNYTLTIQCIVFIMCLFFMAIFSFNYYSTGPHQL